MVPTPLQTMLQIDALPRDMRTIVESVLVLVGLLGAFAVRRRKRAVTATTFLLLSGSALIDAGSRFIPNDAGRPKGRGRGVRTFPVRRDPAGARIRRRDDAPRQGPLLDHQQGPADAHVVVRGRDGGAVHRLRRAAAFDPDDHHGLRGGARLRAAGDPRQHLQRPVALDGAAVRAGRLDSQRRARRAGQGNRMARDDDRDARQRAARDTQLGDRQGRAVQLRDRPRARRDYRRDQLRRAAQSRARSRAYAAARRAASAARSAARSSGRRVMPISRSSIRSSTGLPTTARRNTCAIASRRASGMRCGGIRSRFRSRPAPSTCATRAATKTKRPTRSSSAS